MYELAAYSHTNLSLCSGVGGMDLGLQRAGFRTVCYVERDEYRIQALIARMQEGCLDHAPIWDDVSSFDGRPWRGRIYLLSAGFPCFAEGTLVLSEHGYIPIESLSVGDNVLTHKGRWRPVTAVMSRNDAPLRRIYAGGCSEIVTTDEHPFWARVRDERKHARQFDEPCWTQAQRLTSDHFVSQVLPKINPSIDAHTLDFWWLVGRYLADGWLVERKSRETGGRVVMCSAYKEADFLAERIRAAGFHATRTNERTEVKFHITRNSFYHFLLQFGRRAYGKCLPGFIFELDTQRAKALLDGYLSGDGYRTNSSESSNGYWRATTVSKSLALGVALLAQRAYGTIAAIRQYRVQGTTRIEGRTVWQRDMWFVTIPDRNRSAFIEDNVGWKRVRRTEPSGLGTVYNIAVAEDESYIADGAVVHNCQPFSVAGSMLGADDERYVWPHIYRLICEVRPSYVLLENVPGLLLAKRGRSAPLSTLLGDLASIGYDAQWEVLSAAAFGAPHFRRRIFLVAYPHQERWYRLFQDDLQRSVGEYLHWQTSEPMVLLPDRLRQLEQRLSEPSVRGNDDGVAYRVERLAAVGDAVVPHVAEYVGRCIQHHAHVLYADNVKREEPLYVHP